MKFLYFLLYEPGKPISATEPLNLIAEGVSTGPLPAVAWDHDLAEWTFQPGAAVAILHLNSEDHRTRPVDRATAEREVLRFATKELPSEAELTAICQRALGATG